MSVAFTREEDAEAAAAHLPDRPISAHPNLVTATGLAKLDAELAAAREAYASAQASKDIQADRAAMARASRDLRYFAARRATAQLVDNAVTSEAVVFGSKVTFRRSDGRVASYRIVGEDEADASQGSISYVSPLAKTLFGKAAGDPATLGGSELDIIAVE